MRHKTPAPEVKEASSRCETRSLAIQIKATADDGTIEGYGSVFGVMDSYDDVIAPGAFAASLAAHKAAGTMPAMLWQHETDEPIGIWTDMVEDAKGLRIKGKLALDTVRGKEAQVLCKMGALNGLSIGFMSKAWSYDQETNVRTLTEIDLWEVSIVTFPSNQSARVTGVKNAAPISTIRQAEQALRDVGVPADKAKEVISLVKQVVIAERDASEAAAKIADRSQRFIKTITSGASPCPK